MSGPKIKRYRGWTYEEVRDALPELKAAYRALAVSGAQSYTVGSRTLTRLNIKDLQAQIEYFGDLLDGMETGVLPARVRFQQAVPADF